MNKLFAIKAADVEVSYNNTLKEARVWLQSVTDQMNSVYHEAGLSTKIPDIVVPVTTDEIKKPLYIPIGTASIATVILVLVLPFYHDEDDNIRWGRAIVLWIITTIVFVILFLKYPR